MALRDDCSGLESIPMRLMVLAVVVSMSIVPAARALESFEEREFLIRAGAELDRIVFAAQALTIQGPGAARTLDIDLSGGGSLRFESVTIGDGPSGPNTSSVVLRLSTGTSIIRMAREPAAIMTGPGQKALVLTDPRFELHLSARMDGYDMVIVAEVM